MLRTTGHIICLHCIYIHCTCYVVMIYLRDSEQLIEKKNQRLKLSQMLWSPFRENACLAQVVRENEKDGLIRIR